MPTTRADQAPRFQRDLRSGARGLGLCTSFSGRVVGGGATAFTGGLPGCCFTRPPWLLCPFVLADLLFAGARQNVCL